jgi:voltage-gated sodium channel
MQAALKKIVNDPRFERTIVLLIVINAIVLGMETYSDLESRFGMMMLWINHVVLAVFVLEAAMKITAVAPRFEKYFGDGWNIFDFSVVALSLIPMTGQYAMVARLARLLRVMRLMSTLPELRLIVSTLVRSIPGFINVLLLLFIIFYIYAISGYYLLHEHDPTHWRTLGVSLLTLFRVLTLEDWTDVMYVAMQMNPNMWVFFISFVIVATFVVINLFIAVVINNLEAAKMERKIRGAPVASEAIALELQAVREALTRLEARVDEDGSRG